MTPDDILFIVNPVSGKRGSKRRILEFLKSRGCRIRITEYAGHAEKIARESPEKVMVAVGGDGTVNEVARGITGSGKILGIIPCGSGDGLARTIGAPYDCRKNLEAIAAGQVSDLDWGTVDGRPFFSVCGVGFDAIVSDRFARAGSRGLPTYVREALRLWKEFRSEDYVISTDGERRNVNAAMITVANSNQWGNGAKIAPLSSVDDGLLDVCIVHMFKTLEIPRLAFLLMTGKLFRSRRVEYARCREIVIRRNSPGVAHCDGDCIQAGDRLDIRIGGEPLKVIRYR